MEVSSCSSGRMMEWLVGPFYVVLPPLHMKRERERDRIVTHTPHSYKHKHSIHSYHPNYCTPVQNKVNSKQLGIMSQNNINPVPGHVACSVRSGHDNVAILFHSCPITSKCHCAPTGQYCSVPISKSPAFRATDTATRWQDPKSKESRNQTEAILSSFPKGKDRSRRSTC